jgi:hypothetical protein
MNRWVSTRRALKAFEIPRDTNRVAARGGRALGVALVALGAYVALVLWRLDPRAVTGALAAGPNASLAEIGIESARWFLVLGGVAGMATGIMLLFFPRAWHAVEAHANHWHSTRQLAAVGDSMHLGPDRIAEAFPRLTGWVILAMSAVSAVASGLLLVWRP